jgi:ABC-type Fe3+ transport system substrate-binding protein
LKKGASTVPNTGTLAMMDRAPHPEVTRIFINWFLSRDGQMAYQRNRIPNGRGTDSLRIDIPKDNVPPWSRRRTTGKYLMSTRPEWIDLKPIPKTIQRARLETGKR